MGTDTKKDERYYLLDWNGKVWVVDHKTEKVMAQCGGWHRRQHADTIITALNKYDGELDVFKKEG